jgi:hypothetical protein
LVANTKMINLKEIRDIVYQIFSESGYSVKNVNIQFPQPLNIKITKNEDKISLDFTDNTPQLSWKRFITLSANINGLSLGETGGTLKLKYLPDIDFSYEKTQELMFGQVYDFSDIENEIVSQYQDDARQKLANKCLQYGTEWATIASQSTGFHSSSVTEQRILKEQCKEFIRENIKKEKRHGSAILTFILLYVLLPVVLKFIIERIFNKIFN